MNLFLNFSDGAKFADIARNIISGSGYGINFSFWSKNIFFLLKDNLFLANSIPPVMPTSIALAFKIFGVNDFAVVITSFFYFFLTIVFIFLLAKSITKNNLVPTLSVLAVAFNYNLINYATSGASESPFVFEIVAASYFISVKKKGATFVAVFILVMMYFTRPLAFIYIAGEILYYLISRYKFRTAFSAFVLISAFALLIDRFVFGSLTSGFFYSITFRGLQAAGQYVPGEAVSNALRGDSPFTSTGSVLIPQILRIGKKIFYNLYNFYKLMPQILNPYLFAIFIIGLFKWTKDKIYNSFKATTVFMLLFTLLVTALSIPFFRYIHPILPLVYIVAVETLVWIVERLFKERKQIIFASTFLIILLAMGQTLGIILLDSRFERKMHNTNKPPVYATLSYRLRDNTNKEDVVLTNLDTWGTWYGERKTVWFPLEPKQIINPANGKIPFDAIYLTDYRIDDENYYMGIGWRQIFNNPEDSGKWVCDGCVEIAKEFKLKNVYLVSAKENYERQDARAILLIRKN